jgi:hypothetical protein
MTAEAAALTRTWRVGRFEVTLTIPKPRPGEIASASVEWSPTAPTSLSSRELALYRRRRNEAIADLARELDINVAVLDL